MSGPGNPGFKTGGRRPQKNGYVSISGHKGHPNARGGSIYEHVLVMSQMLGRPLRKGEEVHHKNTIRDDNTPDNLELWDKSQPPGGRVEDRLNWCEKYLLKYRPSSLSTPTKSRLRSEYTDHTR